MDNAEGESPTSRRLGSGVPERRRHARTSGASPPGNGADAHHKVPPYEVGMYDSYGVQLYYEIHGHGPKVLVFMHGILMDSKMNRRLAADLAALGHRVVLLDLPGHGMSEKPRRASYHRIDTYGRHVVALLDHLGVDQAVIGGVSLGGNVSLMVAAQNPNRVRGLVIEMPVLEWALPAAALTFTPLLLGVHFARPILERTSAFFRWLPRTGNGPLDSVVGGLSNRPRETAAVLHGILAGPIAPTVGQRASMDIPALVIGHQVDRIHPFHDAEQLSHRLPRAELLQANSIFELRMRPERLTGEIDAFLDRVWSEPKTARQAG
jgi:pimeloyl-ACP methyl ester carboxylesterase